MNLNDHIVRPVHTNIFCRPLNDWAIFWPLQLILRDNAHLFGKWKFHFSPTWGPNTPQKGAVFEIFGCGASDLRDGQREFNETFTQCVIDTRDDARLYGKWKFSFLTYLGAKNPQNRVVFRDFWMWSVRSQRWAEGI